MNSQRSFSSKTALTDLAFEGAGVFVDSHMRLEISSLVEFLITTGALKRPLPCLLLNLLHECEGEF